MFYRDLKRGFLSSYYKKEDGNMALTFALSMTLVMSALGAATDFSSLASSSDKAQSIADSVALTAAIYIKDHDRPPPSDEEGYRDGVTYQASDLGFEFKNVFEASEEGPNGEAAEDGVTVRVVYDDDAKEARVTVRGASRPSFTQVFGKDRLPFSSTSVVSYLETEDSFPASISLVLDNSGSMAWDDRLALPNGASPSGAIPRIDGLKTSVNTFVRELDDRLEEVVDGQRIMRMSMLPYSSDLIEDRRVSMRFNFLRPGQVNAMVASGATNSNPPMMIAAEEMNRENLVHRREASRNNKEYVEPLKFVIFMSDGQNTVGRREFIPDSSSPFWWDYRPQFDRYDGPVRQQTPFHRHQGYYRSPADRFTVDACNELKAGGTQIFTIGYGLDVGNYNTNNPFFTRSVRRVTLESQSNAFALLSSCASSGDHFVRADDAEALEAAFDTIQNAIVEELIRIKS